MYRVTIGVSASEQISLRVANQDLGRVMALAARVQMLNPGFEVSYQPEERTRESDAA